MIPQIQLLYVNHFNKKVIYIRNNGPFFFSENATFYLLCFSQKKGKSEVFFVLSWEKSSHEIDCLCCPLRFPEKNNERANVSKWKTKKTFQMRPDKVFAQMTLRSPSFLSLPFFASSWALYLVSFKKVFQNLKMTLLCHHFWGYFEFQRFFHLKNIVFSHGYLNYFLLIRHLECSKKRNLKRTK